MICPLVVNNKFQVDVSGKKFVIFTDDQSKLSKYNEWTEDGSKTGYTDTVLSIESIDDDSGLFWIHRPILALIDLETSLIDYYTFTHPLKSISVSASNGALESVIIEIGYGFFQAHQMYYGPVGADTNSDNKLDCLDVTVIGSLPWMLKHSRFCEGNYPVAEDYVKLRTSGGEYVKTSDEKQAYVREY